MPEESLPEGLTFHADPTKFVGWRHYLLVYSVGFALIWFAQIGIRHHYHGVPWPELWASDGYHFVWSGALFGLGTLLFTAIAATRVDWRLLRRVYLRLDREGLTYSRRLATKRWLWCDLPVFVHEPGQLPPNISFHLPKQKPLSLRQGMIEDLYDAPLTEIANTLNKFRERALAEAKQ